MLNKKKWVEMDIQSAIQLGRLKQENGNLRTQAVEELTIAI